MEQKMNLDYWHKRAEEAEHKRLEDNIERWTENKKNHPFSETATKKLNRLQAMLEDRKKGTTGKTLNEYPWKE